jgi:peptidoglycan hydrolase CwlO-like protein
MSYENELQTYIKELENTVVLLNEKINEKEAKIIRYKQLISILDTQQLHVDL